MYKFLSSFVILFIHIGIYGQCNQASPFCTDVNNYNFPNSTNVANLGSVDCLGSTPNPAWYHMQIDQAGTMDFTISQNTTSGTPIDVDFIIWGPFSSLADACTGANPFPSGSVVDCSYSSDAVEQAVIPNAQPGQVYVVLITNFSNQAGNISFTQNTQTSGSGSADCSFVCGVTSFTAVPSECSNNQYTLNGTLNISNPPTSGTLVIQSSCGGSQTFNAPFPTVINYSLPNLTADGAQCGVTTTFSANSQCNSIETYTAPSPCNNQNSCSVAITATPGQCEPATNTFPLTGTLTLTNPPATGTLTVTSSCGGTQTFNAPFTSPLNYNLTGLTANGSNCTVTASFSAITCTGTQSFAAPASCGCTISNLTTTPSACANDLYDLSGSITFSTPPATGQLTVTTSCGGIQTFNAPFTSPLNYNLAGLNANGAQCTVTATFSANTSCTRTANYNAPAACLNPPCVTSPFCSNQGTTTFPAGTNQTAASVTYPGNNYGCLGSSPNPQWYYMQIANGGNMTINMNNSAGVDIDYILYGPYPSYTNAMTYCNSFGTAGSGSSTNGIVDCSYSSSANESATINNATAGSVYILLITNFSNSPTNISFSSSGTATTDCSILSCNVTGVTATPTACVSATNTYSVNGSVSFSSPPNSGTLTLTSSCGATQTFNAPFGTGVNYTLSNLPSNGASCSITAAFSAAPACSLVVNYLAPADCSCSAVVGTYNSNITGNSTSPVRLCFGDTLNITSNNNWTPPAEIVGATTPGHPNYDPNAPTYNPGIVWLVYGCPPTVALTPAQSAQSGLDVNDDPCLIGIVGGTPNLSDINDTSLINALPPGSITNNTLYFVPLTMYSIVDGIYSYVIAPNNDCYELGAPIVVQYLNPINAATSSNCANGTASLVMNGGSPQSNGGNYNYVAGTLIPSTATMLNTSVGQGGTLVIGNLQTGNYSLTIQDDNGCINNVNGFYLGPQSANLTYPDNIYCLDEGNPSPIMIGDQGGTYTSGAGLSLNATTGVITLSTSTPGAYAVTYTSPGPNCPATSTFNLTIEAFPNVSAGNDTTICLGVPIALSGSGAASYSWNNGAQNGVPYLPNLGLNEFIVTGTSINGCKSIDTIQVIVVDDCNIAEDVIFWVPNTFTPDGDQYNQTFKPIFYSGFDPYDFDLFIFNRWGEPIWESHDVNVGWDGSYNNGMKCPDGAYTWKIRFKLLNNDEKRTVVGHLNLLR